MNDRKYLNLALDIASKSEEPIQCGCLIVDNSGKVMAGNFNSQRFDNLTAAHAEMKCIAEANLKIGRKLTGLTAYCSCEPCTMCLTALIFANVKRIVFANRLNDLVDKDNQIDIDCFTFVRAFPHSPRLEHVKV